MEQTAMDAVPGNKPKKKIDVVTPPEPEVEKAIGQRVDRTKVNPPTLSRYLGLFGLKTSGTLDLRVARLELFIGDCFARRFEGEGDARKEHPQSVPVELLAFLMVCDCGASFDDRCVCCPFCGSDDPSPKISNKQRLLKGYRQADATNELRARFALVREVFGISPEPVEFTPAETAPELPAAPAPEPVDAKHAPLVQVRGKGAPMQKAPPFASASEPAAIVIPEGSLEELDAKKAEAARLYGEMVEGAARVATDTCELGKVLGEIEDRKLYLQRRDGKGVPTYKSMSQFLNAEFEFGATYGYDLIGFAKKFTSEQIQSLGTGRLKYLVRVIETEAGKALTKEAAERGLTVGEVRGRVNALEQPRAGSKSEPPSSPGSSTGGSGDDGGDHDIAPVPATDTKPKTAPSPKPSGKAPKGPDPKPEADRITCALLPGRQTIALLARPTKKGAVPKVAKKVGDDPWCEITYPNGVTQTFRVMVVKGALKLTIDTRRAE